MEDTDQGTTIRTTSCTGGDSSNQHPLGGGRACGGLTSCLGQGVDGFSRDVWWTINNSTPTDKEEIQVVGVENFEVFEHLDNLDGVVTSSDLMPRQPGRRADRLADHDRTSTVPGICDKFSFWDVICNNMSNML